MKLWLDTNVVVASLLTRDTNHERALRLMQRIRSVEWQGVYTSDYVVAEVLNLLRTRVGVPDIEERALRLLLGRPGQGSILAGLIRIDPALFALSVERFRQWRDQGLSFTDCTSLVAMDEARVRCIATFDAGFAGLAEVVDG